MHFLKLFHFAALICWCGSLLYLPTLIVRAAAPGPAVQPARFARQVFIGLATPAALLAIGSGTVIFLVDGVIAGWLAAKLTVVAGMVLCHALCGAMILKAEKAPAPFSGAARLACVGNGFASACLIGLTLWLVLAKPF